VRARGASGVYASSPSSAAREWQSLMRLPVPEAEDVTMQRSAAEAGAHAGRWRAVEVARRATQCAIP